MRSQASCAACRAYALVVQLHTTYNPRQQTAGHGGGPCWPSLPAAPWSGRRPAPVPGRVAGACFDPGEGALGNEAYLVAGHFDRAVRGLPCSDLEAMCGSPGAAMRTATSFTPRRNQAIPGLLRGVEGVALVRPAAHQGYS